MSAVPPAAAAAPPPPPSASIAQDRRRFPVQPPTLSTASLPGQRHGLLNTPASALTGSLPFSPAVSSATSISSSRDPSSMPSRGTSSMTVAYDPSEWHRNAPAGMNYVSHSATASRRRVQGTQNVTGMEAAMPSPPPPYSASPASTSPATSRHQRTSPHMPTFSPASTSPALNQSDYNTPVSAATTVSSSGFSGIPRSASQALQHASPSSFPPPPPSSQRDRSTSRSRFNLGGIASRVRGLDNSSPPNAMDALQQHTIEALTRSGMAPPSSFPLSVNPPAARRAVSAGAVRPGPGPDFARSVNEAGQTSFGLALPGPPPGPPPSSRSQSMSRASDHPIDHTLPFRTALPTSSLGPVPPTPADWAHGDDMPNSNTPEQFQTSPASVSSANGQAGPSFFEGTARDLAPSRSIRERRSESRARAARDASREPMTAIEQSSNPWTQDGDIQKPANLILGSQRGFGLERRRHVSKSKTSPLFSSPDSPQFRRQNRVHSAGLAGNPTAASLPNSAPVAQTPPLSALANQESTGGKAPSMTNGSLRDLPTPITGETRSPGQRSAQCRPTDRSQSSARDLEIGVDAFAEACLRRFKTFMTSEASAPDDLSKLQLFADFIVNESRIRRDRYADAFESIGSEVLELTRDLWRPLHGRCTKTPTPSSASIATSGTSLRQISQQGSDSLASGPNSAFGAPKTSQASPTSCVVQPRERSNSRLANSYVPALSPILSMAQSTTADDSEGSRGRAPSRWWEASQEGASVGEGRKIERSKRESKYMGVAREVLQREIDSQSPELFASCSGPSYAHLGPNEYPQEKAGWHEDNTVTPVLSPQPVRTPVVKRRTQVDVSRLITLPPPYPRHHPALNNSHPELTTLRQSYRSITDKSQVFGLRQNFDSQQVGITSPEDDLEVKRRQRRQQISDQVSSGKLSFAEAAELEAQQSTEEEERRKALAQKTFDQFQAEVMSPLTAVFAEKINAASASIDYLREGLNDEARSRDPSLTQEEGDEKPELLEKLTLLKWLFEAREQLHSDNYALESESDDMYKNIIMKPYEIAGAQDKIEEVEAFFAKDKRQRKALFEKKSLRRFESMLAIIEQHVTRGVELQLSAFWDIAPGLVNVLQQIPNPLERLEIMIPADEFEESPTYHEHPLQYLYSLLCHAEKSAYQFIESQTNLLCLLHEVKTGVMQTGCKLIETQREQAGEDPSTLGMEMQGVRRDEDARLTNDLKEKVDIAEDQWKEALGAGLSECKSRVKGYLEKTRGWIDELDE